jgi:hypothetical protein
MPWLDLLCVYIVLIPNTIVNRRPRKNNKIWSEAGIVILRLLIDSLVRESSVDSSVPVSAIRAHKPKNKEVRKNPQATIANTRALGGTDGPTKSLEKVMVNAIIPVANVMNWRTVSRAHSNANFVCSSIDDHLTKGPQGANGIYEHKDSRYALLTCKGGFDFIQCPDQLLRVLYEGIFLLMRTIPFLL